MTGILNGVVKLGKKSFRGESGWQTRLFGAWFRLPRRRQQHYDEEMNEMYEFNFSSTAMLVTGLALAATVATGVIALVA